MKSCPLQPLAFQKPVDIVCESSEFSVDRRWMKLERNTPQLAASCVSLDSHNSPLRRIPGRPHTTNQLERFPLIHSDHHNNKFYWSREVSLKTISELKSCSDDVVDKSLPYAVAGTTPLDYGSSPLVISTGPNQRWDFSLPCKASTVPQQQEVQSNAIDRSAV